MDFEKDKKAVVVRHGEDSETAHGFNVGQIVEFKLFDGADDTFLFKAGNLSQWLVKEDFDWI